MVFILVVFFLLWGNWKWLFVRPLPETKVKDNVIKVSRKYMSMTRSAFRPQGSRLFDENFVTKWAVKSMVRKAMTICQGWPTDGKCSISKNGSPISPGRLRFIATWSNQSAIRHRFTGNCTTSIKANSVVCRQTKINLRAAQSLLQIAPMKSVPITNCLCSCSLYHI